jgi:putative transposase
VQRGIEGVEYAVSDEHLGLVQALGLYFPEAALQRCQVHYIRNALSYVTTDAYRTAVREDSATSGQRRIERRPRHDWRN